MCIAQRPFLCLEGEGFRMVAAVIEKSALAGSMASCACPKVSLCLNCADALAQLRWRLDPELIRWIEYKRFVQRGRLACGPICDAIWNWFCENSHRWTASRTTRFTSWLKSNAQRHVLSAFDVARRTSAPARSNASSMTLETRLRRDRKHNGRHWKYGDDACKRSRKWASDEALNLIVATADGFGGRMAEAAIYRLTGACSKKAAADVIGVRYTTYLSREKRLFSALIDELALCA